MNRELFLSAGALVGVAVAKWAAIALALSAPVVGVPL